MLHVLLQDGADTRLTDKAEDLAEYWYVHTVLTRKLQLLQVQHHLHLPSPTLCSPAHIPLCSADMQMYHTWHYLVRDLIPRLSSARVRRKRAERPPLPFCRPWLEFPDSSK